ncbi:T-cell surface antigen CD2 [Heteronotia binoei]|uniref:T-cell surface antigen CD2 n=1 Tax=Heteronotia binoei TaxID=13085 RepID=UPI00292F6A15|nr:T-cell surface antigen CD2 [Heteronotia binoei]
MNAGNVLLIKFLLTISFCLKGAAACEDVVYGILNHSVILCISSSQGTLHKIEWKMGTKPIASLRTKKKNQTRNDAEKYHTFPNGTLKIERLLKSDAANYTVHIYNLDGILVSNSNLITLHVVEPLPPLKLTYECPKKILSCEVEYNKKPVPSFKLFQEKEEQKRDQELKYLNKTWKVTQQLKSNRGKVSCEASISSSLQKAEIQLSCLGEIDIFLIMYIAGGIITFVIFVALLICCIRKKKAERRTLQAEERELRPANDALKYRKLPQPPVHAAPSQPPQQRQPPPGSEVQQQPGPPLPRPRPHQKPPRRMKDKL